MNNQYGYGSFLVGSNIYVPFEPDQQRIRLTEILREHADAINKREISTYDQRISPTAQSWPPTDPNNTQVRQFTLRKIIPITLGNTTSAQTFPHGIDTNGIIPTNLSCVIGNGSNAFIPLPYPGTDQVLLSADDTNIIITTSTLAWSGFFGNVIFEWLPNTM
jgi:hypothetical protein